MNENTDNNAATAVADAVNDTAIDILGGTNDAAVADTTAENTPVVVMTPGKAARKNMGDKRAYTPRGTTYWARRVILLNGEPVGRGRPAKDGKGERKVVYVPVGMEYDVAVHGEGVKYNTHSHRATHKRIAKDSVSYTFDDGVAPAKATKTVKGGKGKAAKAKGKAAKAKGKTAKAKAPKKAKNVTVPVADVSAPVDTTTDNAAPVSTDAVTA